MRPEYRPGKTGLEDPAGIRRPDGTQPAPERAGPRGAPVDGDRLEGPAGIRGMMRRILRSLIHNARLNLAFGILDGNPWSGETRFA